jgi:predicted nucleotidyltransferase
MSWNIEDHIIFETVTGSNAYGTNTAESDIDYRGICIPPIDVLLGLENFEQRDKWGEEEGGSDRVIYALKKFLLLCKDGNPNIIELLFVPEKFWVRKSDIWYKILKQRDIFMSKKLRYTFSGYAYSQLARIKRHRAWLLNPPKDKPTREEYGLPAKSNLNLEQRSALLSLPMDVVVEEVRGEVEAERAYRQAKKHWDQYTQWQTNRNRKRAGLEEKFGYDTKHASHLVRLIYEGEEALLTGHITLPLPQAEEIQAIKNGKYSYDELLEKVEGWDEKFDRLYEESPLPKRPNMKAVAELYQSILWERFSLPT